MREIVPQHRAFSICGMISRVTFVFFNKLSQNRNLLKNLVKRELRRRYIGSFGGFLWSVIHPLALLASYTFIFSVVFGQQLDPEDGTQSVSVFLFCGIL